MRPNLLAVLAALGLAAVISLPVSTSAKERRADGLRGSDQIELSSVHRKKRHVYRHRAPRYYYRPYYARPYYYYDEPYYAYGYYPYYHRPYPYYYRRGPVFWFGPGGIGFGF